jgi:hypothetical protein
VLGKVHQHPISYFYQVTFTLDICELHVRHFNELKLSHLVHVIFNLVVVKVTYAWDDDLVHAILTKVTSGCVHNWDVIIKTSLILCFMSLGEINILSC